MKIIKQEVQAVADLKAGYTLGHADVAILNELARIALASLEAEAVSINDDMAYAFHHALSDSPLGADEVEEIKAGLRAALANVTAPPAPASVPDGVLKSLLPDAEKSEFWFEHDGKILFEGVKFNNAVFDACRAVMLQGADGTLTNEGTIPATQFKPVADLYGLTSPTGGETSFTFDAVEARDFIDGGWLCQEYVELERFQEAITNHTEDKLAMVDHSGDSNNMVEPVTTAYKLPANVIDALEKALQAMSFMGDTLNDMDAVCEEDIEYVTPAFDAVRKVLEGNSPVIPDGFCIMPKKLTAENGGKGALSGEFHVTNRIVCQSCGGEGCEDCNDEGGWDAEIPVSWDTIKRIHEAAVEACSLPAAPQQEVK
ncbi:hypothetical protein [Enterobacter hormaechei]|uniref:hypothetical protein n=1 Tax=Enterobacter hormaechei TaxID=158836 RepID=UPI001D12499F|nr:hypothetical protein [Enterobacter hormaechei]MCC2918950.1 hypothetical protein [Enterobacter hormaechei]